MVVTFADEWRSHEDTAELSSLLSANVDRTETAGDSENDEDDASSCSEQLDDEDQSSNDDDDDVPFTGMSSRNPFELLADDN